MTCSACQQAIEAHLDNVSGVMKGQVNLLTHKANILYAPDIVGVRDLIEEIEAIGFGAKLQQNNSKAGIK